MKKSIIGITVAGMLVLGTPLATNATQYGVGSYSPSSSSTCEEATFSHPAVNKPGFGEGELTYSVNGGPEAPYNAGSPIVVPFEGATVVEFRIYSRYSPTFKHQFGVTKVFQGECADPEPEPSPAPEEPETPTDPPVAPGEPEVPAEVETPAEGETPNIVTDFPAAPEPAERGQMLAETGATTHTPWIAGVALALLTAGFLILHRARIKGMTE